jgi:hypothetical protein
LSYQAARKTWQWVLNLLTLDCGFVSFVAGVVAGLAREGGNGKTSQLSEYSRHHRVLSEKVPGPVAPVV